MLDKILAFIAQKLQILTAEATTNVSSFQFYKRGKIVTCVSRYPSLLNPTTAWGYVGTLPQEYRPPMDIQAPCLWGNYAAVNGLIQIKTNGQVSVYASSKQTSSQSWTAFAYSVN